MRKILILTSIFSLLTLAFPVFGQVDVQVQQVELAVPFGIAKGSLVTVGDYLVFVDEEDPRDSFAVTRSQIRDVTADDYRITLTTETPVMVRDDSRSELNFRLRRAEAAPALANWVRAEAEGKAAAAAKAADPSTAQKSVIATYEAKHDHGFMGGSCRGQFMITGSGLAYDSVDNISHSRQWKLTDIKELELDNPYELEVDVFTGNDYDLQFIGKGMDNARFQQLVDRITQARVTN